MLYRPGNPRYQRQTALKEFGEQAQEKLQNARILVVGAGGLGSPALQYLTGAGIGTLGIVDHDIVSLANLHRQTIYSVDDIGLKKASRAQEILSRLNPEIDIICYFSDFDIIMDGTDNFATRYMINDACVILGKTLIFGAVSKFEGQVAIFNHYTDHTPVPVNYRDLFPEPPVEGEILNCEEAGVLGVLPGIIGTMMANEALKLITGIGRPLTNILMTYNSLTNQAYELELETDKSAGSKIPKTEAAFRATNYEWLCSSQSALEIDSAAFTKLLNNPNAVFIDIRELNETPAITEFHHSRIPMNVILRPDHEINATTLVLVCQSGKRSLTAAKALVARYGDLKKIYSLRNGILNWKNSITS
jgi:molybdopterin/thiamine biosynthesis adenylyltransferase/rhodanese-related sulfurtransferase